MKPPRTRRGGIRSRRRSIIAGVTLACGWFAAVELEDVLGLRMSYCPSSCPTIEPQSVFLGRRAGQHRLSDQARQHRSICTGRGRPLSQGGDTGSNPVGAANWPVPLRPSQRYKSWVVSYQEVVHAHAVSGSTGLVRGRSTRGIGALRWPTASTSSGRAKRRALVLSDRDL
jgi:hypothetical protein